MSASRDKVRGATDFMQANKTKKTALLAMMFALAAVLSWLESLLPIPTPAPGIKLGLSNTVTMYCVLFLGPASALTLALLKGALAALTRGLTAGLLSTAGGLISIGAMLFASRLGSSIKMVSVCGATAHNMAQLAVCAIMLRSKFALWYLPVLILSGIVMGLVTGAVSSLLMPALKKLGLAKQKQDPKERQTPTQQK